MKRFEVTSKAATGRTTRRRCDTVVEAWDWFSYFTATAPLNEVEIIDHEQDVEARA